MTDEVPSPDTAAAGVVPPTGATTTVRAAAAARLEAIAPGYLDHVRRVSLRLGHRDSPVIDVVTALADVEDTAGFDLEVPTLSRLRSGRLVKVAIRKLVSWYLRYLTQQVAAFSAAVTRFGAVVVERTDQIEATTEGLGRDLQRLRQRVERLEEAGAGPQNPPSGAGPQSPPSGGEDAPE